MESPYVAIAMCSAVLEGGVAFSDEELHVEMLVDGGIPVHDEAVADFRRASGHFGSVRVDRNYRDKVKVKTYE